MIIIIQIRNKIIYVSKKKLPGYTVRKKQRTEPLTRANNFYLTWYSLILYL